jgi:putative hydrolase of the HAD superfamily
MATEPSARRLRPLAPIPTALAPSGALRQKVGGILFDIYGTLFISASGDIGTARRGSPQGAELAELLARFGVREAPEAVLDRFFEAIAAHHRRQQALGVGHPEVVIDRIWRSVLNWGSREKARDFAVAFELIANPVYPMPGLAQTLGSLKAAGLRLGLISNAQFFTPLLFTWFLDADTSALGFDPELVFYSYRCGLAKPSLRLFEAAAAACRRKGLAPAGVLYVGNDVRNDVRPAQQTGFQTALFAGDRRSLRLREDDPACRGVRPDLVITHLPQLIDRCLASDAGRHAG